MDHNVRLCALKNEEEIWFNRLSYYPGTKVMGGEMSFWICILFKIPTEGPKNVYHSKFFGFFFLFLNKTHFIFVYLQKKVYSQIHEYCKISHCDQFTTGKLLN